MISIDRHATRCNRRLNRRETVFCKIVSRWIAQLQPRFSGMIFLLAGDSIFDTIGTVAPRRR